MIRFYAWILWCLRQDVPAGLRREMTATFADVILASSSEGRLAAARAAVAEYADAATARFRRDPLEPPRRREPSSRRGSSMLPSLHDWKNAVRRAVAHPAYSATVVGVLALGISVNTIVFSVADSTLFRGLPYPNGAQLMEVVNVDPTGKFTFPGLTPDTFAEWRAQSDVFEALEGWNYASFIMLGGAEMPGGAEPKRIAGAYVTPGLFDALGVRPVRGRGFEAHDGEPGRDDRVLISDGLWRQRFAGSDDAIGRRLVLNDRPFTVVGVMPPHFRFPASHQVVWLPAALEQPAGGRLQGYGRLRPGLTRETAQPRLNARADALAQQKPRADGWKIRLAPARGSTLNPAMARALQILTGAVLLVMLIACANLANLGVAQALARRRELAIRAALGASRWRLVRELFAEQLLLGLAGGAAGLTLAVWGVPLAIRIAPDALTLWTPSEIRIDGRILAYTAGLTLASALLFGILPAWRASRTDAGDALKSRTSGALAHGRLRAGLVIVEVALSVVLLTGAALLIRSFTRLTHLDPGFDPKGLLSVQFEVPTDRYPAGAARRAFLEAVAAGVRQVPGVTAVSIANGVPPSGGAIYFGNLEVEGRPREQTETVLPATSVDPTYFSTLRIPVTTGRGLAIGDPLTSAVVSDSFARKLAGGGASALGTRFRLLSSGDWYTVVGVAGEVRQDRKLERETVFEMYVPIWRPPAAPAPNAASASRARAGGARSFVSYTLAIRAAPDAQVAAAIKQAIWRVDAAQPVGEIQPADALLSQSLSEDRFAAILMASFAALALVLAAAGLFAVLAQLVAQRRQEIGIRMALGASARDVARLVVGRSVAMTMVGIAIGLAAAWGSARFLASQLYDVLPHDPISFTVVPLALLTVALLASWIPARRALSVDPVAALRAD